MTNESPSTLEQRGDKLKTSVLLILLKSGIQAQKAATQKEAFREHRSGIIVWRLGLIVGVRAGLPDLRPSERRPLELEQLQPCHRALMSTFTAALGPAAAKRWIEFYRKTAIHISILLPAPNHQRTLDKYLLRH